MDLEPLAKELLKLLSYLYENDTDTCKLKIEHGNGKACEAYIEFKPIN